MNLIRMIKKPEYIFRPQQIVKRTLLGNKKAPLEVDLFWGHKSFSIDPSESIGKSIASFGLYDLAITEAIVRILNPGDLFLDIGANIGVFTSLASHRGAEVHSFEPHPKIFANLEANCGQLPNTTLHKKALSKQPGSLDLYIPINFDKNEGLASLNPQDNAKTVTVDVETLNDTFANQTIKLMKVDVEGHELEVFQGGEKLLDNGQIEYILFEEFDGSKAKTIAYLKSKGYHVYRLFKGFLNLQVLNPEYSDDLPLWEPANFIASKAPLEWSNYGFWKSFRI